MPRMDGLSASRRIRELQAAGMLPPPPPPPAASSAGGPAVVPVRDGRLPKIIALTANAASEDRDDCLDAGMDSCASLCSSFHASDSCLIFSSLAAHRVVGSGDSGAS